MSANVEREVWRNRERGDKRDAKSTPIVFLSKWYYSGMLHIYGSITNQDGCDVLLLQ